MSEISKKIHIIEKLANSGNFTPISIKILIDIALSFDDLSYANYIEILKGAHVVIRNDSGGYWGKWKYWAEELQGNCINKNTKSIVEGAKKKNSCIGDNEFESENEWVSYESKRWSSHPSVKSISLRGKEIGDIHGGIFGKSIDQYEINMGHNRHGSTFSMLCGIYEWRDLDNYTEQTKSHTGSMYDPKKIKLDIENTSYDRDYLVTWFQFEQYAANIHIPNEGFLKKSAGIISHCLDWASYKWTQKNIGPFGRSQYTENPWKPLYIHCCPDVCYRRSIKTGRHTKIKDVNYSSEKICSESEGYLRNRYGKNGDGYINDDKYISKDLITDIIMKKNYCYYNALPCNSDNILYKGNTVKTCDSTEIQSIIDENSEGGRKKNRKTYIKKYRKKTHKNKTKLKNKRKSRK